MRDLLIFPCGGNAREALAVIEAQNRERKTWNVVGFLDDNRDLWGKYVEGVRVIGGGNLVHKYGKAAVLAVPGNPGRFLERERYISLLGLPMKRFAVAIDPSARIAKSAKIGQNVVIMANGFVGASVQLGNHCIVLCNTVIAHDTIIAPYTILGAHVTISGSCLIGKGCYVSSGTCIKDHVKVGSHSLVGLGSNVLSDVSERSVTAGNPAREIKKLAYVTNEHGKKNALLVSIGREVRR